MKSSFATLAEIPEAIRSEYVSQDGKFVLKVEGDHPLFVPLEAHNDLKTKLSTFRDNNIGLNNRVTELDGKLKLFGDLTPDAVTEMRTKLTNFEKKGTKTPDDVQAAISDALKPVLEKLGQAEAKQAGLEKEAKLERRKSTLVQAAAKLGVREEAIPDFIYRGTSVFNEDGVPVVEGKELFSKADPTRHLSVDEFVSNLRTEAPHLFKPSGGGGAQPGAGAPPKLVVSSDPMDFGRNLEAIAKGDAVIAASR